MAVAPLSLEDCLVTTPMSPALSPTDLAVSASASPRSRCIARRCRDGLLVVRRLTEGSI